MYIASVTVEHVLPPKNAMSPVGFDPGTSRIVSHHSTKISTNAVSRGGYEPTTVPITLGRSVLVTTEVVMNLRQFL